MDNGYFFTFEGRKKSTKGEQNRQNNEIKTPKGEAGRH